MAADRDRDEGLPIGGMPQLQFGEAIQKLIALPGPAALTAIPGARLGARFGPGRVGALGTVLHEESVGGKCRCGRRGDMGTRGKRGA